jgi:hypothetical protein
MTRKSSHIIRTMANYWRQPGLVLFLFISGLAPSAYGMSNRRHGGYDERPLHITAQLPKRDATICPTSYSLCPASVSGGCCPTDSSCGVSSCYPTTAAGPAQCSDPSGYIACGIDEGGRNSSSWLFFSTLTSTGGCCPSGYSCARNGCIAPAGSTYSQDCSIGSYLCPSSFGYGCCHSNLACGVGYCYSTSFSSVPVTITYTTTISSSITRTITTVIQTAYTESAAQAIATPAAASSTVTKFTPSATAVAKVDASSDSSSGLTQAELGGIIGAAVVVVLVVCVATFLIIRRLNAVARVTKAAALRKSGLSGSNTKSSSRPRPHGPTPSGGYSGIEGIEAMSVDPLMMSDSDTNAAHSSVGLPRPSAVYSTRSDLEPGRSPPIPAPYGSPQAYIGGYQRVPMSEPHYSDGSGHHRNQSAESPDRSRSPRSGNAGGYFDIDPALRDQNLRHGRVPSRPSVQSHGRQWSDASDVSQQSGGSDIIELDAGPDGDRRSSLQRATQGVGFSRIGGYRQSVEGRRRSTSGGAIARRDVGAAPGMSQRLENVQEAELDSREKSAGPSVTATEVPRARTAYQSQFHEMGISAIGPSGQELERLEQQKVMGNLGDIRRDL